jgi:SsrA-binding protein
MAESHVKVITTNRKARHEYHIEEILEAGIALTGTEIKAIRGGRVSIQEAFVQPRGDELWVLGMHIGQYEPAHRDNHEPLRPRKLLLHRREIDNWADAVQVRGYTIVPLRLYLSDGLAKLEIALARGKRLYDKRQDIAKRDAKRKIDRALNERGN